MITFTVADITAARDNDLEATQLLMDALLPVIDNMARKIASAVARFGNDLAEDIAGEGRLELWRLISVHDGDERHGSGWLVKSIRAHMISARVRLANSGASEWEMDVFLRCLKKTDKDGAAALKMATELPPKQRLSPSAAYAAYTAWVGPISADTPAGEWGTISDFIAAKEDPEDNWTLSARIEAVHETLATMSEIPAQVVLRLYGYGQNRHVIADALGLDSAATVSNHKSTAENQFYKRFPWEDVYPGPKPPMNKQRDTRTK